MTMNDRRANGVEAILIIGIFICILLLCLYRLETYPAPGFDEGLNFQAAKNVALDGQYGLRSTEGFVGFHPALQTGPTVLLPVALVFRLAGTGVLQARLVSVFYTVLALAVFYWLVRKICDRKVAFLASLLLIFTFDHEFTSFVFMGRQMLGEIPALAFFWMGTLLWFRAWKSPRWVALVCPGLLWGLAMLTKVQFALVLPAALLLFWLFDRISHKKLQIRQILVSVLVSGLCVLVWYGYQVLSLGFADFWQQSTELGSAGVMHFCNLSPRRMVNVVLQLLGSQLILFGLPGMLYIVGSNLQKREESEHHQVFLVTFTIVWLGWYTFLSIGWVRYAFVPATMSTIFTARLLADLWGWTNQHHQACLQRLALDPRHLAVGGMTVMLILSGMLPLVKEIVQSPDNGLRELAHYLNTNVPDDVVIESWEWEVDLLTEHIYHHPPYEVTNAYTEQIWYDVPVPPNMYDFQVFRPMYLIVGPFAKWTGLYPRDFLEEKCTLLVSAGEYDLYRVEGQEE